MADGVGHKVLHHLAHTIGIRMDGGIPHLPLQLQFLALDLRLQGFDHGLGQGLQVKILPLQLIPSRFQPAQVQ